MVIDFHTHVFPDRLAASTIQKLSEMGHVLPRADGTAEGLLASMRKAGVDLSVILPVATNPRQVEKVNDSAVALNTAFGARGLLSFGCIHPDHEEPEKELKRIAEMGLKGVKLHPVYQGVDLDDPRYLRILECSGKLELVVVTHGGIDVGYPERQHASPDKILRAIQQVGPVKLIAAHMGGWKQWEEAEVLLAETSVYLDTSYATGIMTPLEDGHYRSEELPLMREEQFVCMVRTFGAHRILFGTDSPWRDQRESVREIHGMPLTAAEKAAILGENAERLLENGPET